MLALLIAAGVAAASAGPAPVLDEAAHAIAAGRLDQARTMIATAVAQGAAGEQVDKLMADLEYAAGNYALALPRYEALLRSPGADPAMAERAGIAALRLGQTDKATAFLGRATAAPTASWRAWNARGVAADRRSDWDDADRSYARAEALAPRSAEVANNRAWSLVLRGRWQDALAPLEKAAALDPKSKRIADNLELVRAAVAAELPRRRPGESDADFASRLNDAGLAAHIRGDRRRAIAALSQAIETRSQWFERAANNLKLVEARP